MSEYKREKLYLNPDYEIDTNGVVYSKKGTPLKPYIPKRGGPVVSLYSANGIRYCIISTLVATQFLEKPEGNAYARHKNGDMTDNMADNLEWVVRLSPVVPSITPEYKREKLFLNPDYEIDTEGIVYGKNGYPLCMNFVNGYCQVRVCNIDGTRKAYSIHRLVATQFLECPEGCTQVSHKNGVRDDNRLVNLEWVTPKQNMQHSIQVLGHTHDKCYHRYIVADSGSQQLYFPSIASAGRYLEKHTTFKNGASSIMYALRTHEHLGGYDWRYSTQEEYEAHKHENPEGITDD